MRVASQIRINMNFFEESQKVIDESQDELYPKILVDNWHDEQMCY